MRGQCLQHLLLSMSRVFVSPRVAPFCAELPGFAFPMGIAVVFALLPSSGQVPQKPEVLVTAHVLGRASPLVCFACSPWPCRQHTLLLQTCLSSFSPVCEQS